MKAKTTSVNTPYQNSDMALAPIHEMAAVCHYRDQRDADDSPEGCYGKYSHDELQSSKGRFPLLVR